ncbi:MAG: protein O-mannosyl-transferase family, partial [Candidatus Promineifilaceae bacterium]
MGGLVSSVALGTSTTFWAQATTANIRSMTSFFAALAIYLLILYWQENEKEPDGATSGSERDTSFMSTKRWRLLVLFVLILTLGIGHHTSLIFMGIIFVIFVVSLDRRWMREARAWLLLAVIVLIGLIPLLYLPVRGAAGAVGAPSDLNTLKGFLNHVLALGFRGDFFYFTDPSLYWERLKVMGNILGFQFEPLLLVAVAVGFVMLLWRNRKIAFLLGGAALIMILITAVYRAPQSVEYMMPAYVPLAIILGCAVGYGAAYIKRASDGSRTSEAAWLAAIAVGIVAFSAIAQGFDRFPSYSFLSKSLDTREVAQGILDQSPEGALILADWHWSTPLSYLQEVENKREDLHIEFVYPTDENYGDTWARRIREGLKTGRAVVSTHFDADAFSSLPVAYPLDDSFLYGAGPVTELPDGFSKLDLQLGDLIELVGFENDSKVEIGEEALITLAWQPLDNNLGDSNLFVHLIGEDGILYAQQDLSAMAVDEGLTFTQFRLTPRPGTMPGLYSLMVGAYGAEPLVDQVGAPRSTIDSIRIDGSGTP